MELIAHALSASILRYQSPGPSTVHTIRIYNLMSSADCFGIQVTTRYLPRVICVQRRAYARRRRDIVRDNNGDLYPGIRAI